MKEELEKLIIEWQKNAMESEGPASFVWAHCHKKLQKILNENKKANSNDN